MNALRDMYVGIHFKDEATRDLERIDRKMDEIKEKFQRMGADTDEAGLGFSRMGSSGKRAMNEIGNAAKDATEDLAMLGAAGEGALGRVEDGADDAADEMKDLERQTGRTTAKIALLGTTLTAVFSAGVAASAPLLAGVGALAASFGAAGIGAAAFGAVATSSLKSVFDAAEEVEKLEEKIANADSAKERIKAQKELAAVYAEMSKEQRNALQELQSFKDFWSGFVQEFESPIFQTFANGLKGLKGVLTELKPTIQNVAGVFVELSNEFNKGLQSQSMQRFFDWLETNASESLYNFAHIFGNTFMGIANTIQAFSPLGASIEEWLVKATQRFKEWSAGLSQSTGFQKFIEYAKTNGPLLLDVIGNVVNIAGDLVKALAPLGSVVLQGLSALTGFISTNITPFIDDVFKLVGIETVFNKIKIAYQGLKAAFGGDQQKSVSLLQKLGLSPEQVQKVTQIIGSIKNAFSSVAQSVSSFFSNGGMTSAFRTLSTVLAPVKDLFTTIGQAVSKFVTQVVIPLVPQAKEFIVSTFEAVKPSLRFAVGLFHTVIDVIKTLIQKVIVPQIPTIKDIISTTFNVVTPIIKIASRAFQAVAGVVMFLVKNVVIPLIPKIVPTIQSMWKIAGPILKGIAKMFNLISDAIEWTIEKFGKFINAAKELPGKIGSGIKSMAGKAMSGVTHLVNSLLEGLSKGVNGVTGGINWVLEKIGVKFRIPKWEPPKYARGTDFHPGGLAIVGDGGGPELIRTPSGQIGLSPARSTLTYLPRGTEVLPHRETKALLESGLFPAYKDGVGNGLLHRAWEGVKSFASKAKDIALDIWSYITKPSELMKKVWEKFGVSAPNISGAFGEIGKGTLSLIKDKAIGFVKKKLDGFLSFGSGKVSGNVAQWVRAAMAITGVPASWFQPLVTIAMRESGGNPRAINLWDINAKRGTPSKGLFQTIDPTFQRYKLPGLNDIWNPVHNAVAAIRYMIDRYGSVFNVPGIRNLLRGRGYVGYAEGGIATKPQLAALAENGWKEFIIPTEPSKRKNALRLLAQANAELGYNPNSSGNSSGYTPSVSASSGRPSIVFSPTVYVTVEGGNAKVENNVKAAVKDVLEEMFGDLLDLYEVEVVR
jgi:SLT domain-containing protein/phage-related protein